MLSGTQTIAYFSELEAIPLPDKQFTLETAKSLFACSQFENFEKKPDSWTMSTKSGQKGLSKCTLTAHKISIEEHYPHYGSVDDFSSHVRNIITSLGDVPPFIIHRCKVQVLAKPANFSSSVEMLATSLANINDELLAPFKRAPSFFGVRFRFLPTRLLSFDEEDDQKEDDSESEKGEISHEVVGAELHTDSDDYLTLRIESYSQDVQKLWLEAASLHPCFPPIETESLDRIDEHMRQASDFLVIKCKEFLEQFDKPNTKES